MSQGNANGISEFKANKHKSWKPKVGWVRRWEWIWEELEVWVWSKFIIWNIIYFPIAETMTKGTYRRVYWGLWSQKARVHDDRAVVAGSRWLEQQLKRHILNQKQEAERAHVKWCESSETSKPTSLNIWPTARPHMQILLKQPPAGDQLFKCPSPL